MPRRDSNVVPGSRLGGRLVLPLKPRQKVAERTSSEFNWLAFNRAVELDGDSRKFLELKRAGVLSTELAHQLSVTLKTALKRIRRAVQAARVERMHFERPIAGSSSSLSYRERVSGRPTWTLAKLNPSFTEIMNRERSKLFSENLPKLPFLAGTCRSALMDRKDFQFEVKSLGDSGSFVGLASVYGNVDLGGDLVEAGAFRDTLQSSDRVPALWQHRTDEPVGYFKLRDTPEGLEAQGQLLLDIQRAKEAYSLMKNGVIRGLSIGYVVPNGGSRMINGVRHLKQIILKEISLVTFPMNELASVASVKSDEHAELAHYLSEFNDNLRAILTGVSR